MSASDSPKPSSGVKQKKDESPKSQPVDVSSAHVAGSYDVVQAILLMMLLAVASSASKTVLRPLYGPLLAASWLRFGSFFSIVIFSYLSPNGVKGLRTHFGILAFILFVGPFSASMSARWAAEYFQSPSFSPVISHMVLGYLVLGVGSALWLRITVRLMSFRSISHIHICSLEPVP